MARRVLVPLDGSRVSEVAIWHALSVGDALADGLTLLQVLESPMSPVDAVVSDLDWRFVRAEAIAYLRNVAARLAERGVDVTTAVAVGGAADEIIRAARAPDVACLVIASHGRGAAATFPFGGTTHKVLSRAPRTVMVVRPSGERAASGSPPASTDVSYDRILVPVDGSAASERALSLAASIARRHEATLLVAHLVPEPPAAAERLPRSEEEAELLARITRVRSERGARYLRELESKLSRGDLHIETRLVRSTHLADGVRAAADEHGAGLIAVAARCGASAGGRFGDLTQQLLSEGGCPVIVFQDGSADVDAGLVRTTGREFGAPAEAPRAGGSVQG